jgi:hypothetical protein
MIRFGRGNSALCFLPKARRKRPAAILVLFLSKTLKNGSDGGRLLWTFESNIATS